jgi:hypothetical protein
MADPGTVVFHPDDQRSLIYPWLDRAWLVLLVLLAAYSFNLYRSSRYCSFLGTDFRGYYAAAQIARQRGFAEVYNQPTQEQYQAALAYRCPDGGLASPLLSVSMPYLPVFVLVFLPLTYLDLTSAYLIWTITNLAALYFYLGHFTSILGKRASWMRILQWSLCLPVFSNLALGQMNVFPIICLGEWVLASLRGRRYLAGFWLGGLLVKPHILVLLLPGLVIRKHWRSLAGFLSSALAVGLASALLGGWQGVWSAVQLAARFSGSLIQTGPTMMNFRALALNLEALLPPWLAWAAAICGMLLVGGYTLYLWKRHFPVTGLGFKFLTIATLAATFATTWHSHFYLLMLLLPCMLALDTKQLISPAWRWAWNVGPPLAYALFHLVSPQQARSWFGLGMLALNLLLLAYAAGRLKDLSFERQLK